MKKTILLFSVILFSVCLWAQTLRPVQWASSVLTVSSEYAASPGDFSANKLLGKPEVYPQCGSNGNLWAPATQNGQREFFEVGFSTPQQVNNVRIYQGWGPGAVDTVYVRNASNGSWVKIYEATAINQAACPGADQQLLEINIPTTAYNVNAVRVAINSPVNTNWNEFDAVSIANFDVMSQNATQYVSEVLRVSSEFNPSPGNYSASRIIGPPNAGATCATNVNAWTPLTQSSQREWIEVKFQYPALTNRVTIYQQIAPGAIDSVYLRNASTGNWTRIYTATAAEEPFCVASKILEINFTKTTYPVDAVRIALNSPVVSSYWNEIDAVSLQSDLADIDPSNFYTKADGNWNNAGTWLNGAVPTATDKVVILGSHQVALDADGVAKTISIENGGELTIATSGATLTVGNFNTGGGNDSVVVRGTLNISNGELNIGGRFRQYGSPAQYTQTAGIVRIDGNTGSDATSVADDDYLFESGRNYVSGFSFSGGTLLFVDPPKGASGKLLLFGTGNMYLGTNSHVQFGDGVSTTAGGSPQGFTFTAPGLYVAGDVTINNPSGANRMVTNSGCIQMQALNLIAGTLNNMVSPDLLAASVNNGTINQTGTLDCVGGLTNNGTVSATASFLSIGDVINNTGGSITAPSMYLTGNVTNNGTMSASTTFAFARSNTTNGTTGQTISGTGIFNTSTALLRLDNSNGAGVTLNRSLTVSRIHLSEGKLFLGNNDLTFSTLPVVGGSAAAHIVSNGTGRLQFSNLTTSEVLFPIGTGTSYNPVRINNGNGHTFAVGVKEGFTVAAPGTQHVNREWDINDLTGGAASATLTLQWSAADEDPTFSRSACVISHYDGTKWMKEGTVGAAAGANPYTRTQTGVSNFSPFTVSSSLAVLPVTLQQFRAAKEGESVKLTWQASTNEAIAYFEVERSEDGIQYKSVARVAARNTAGTHRYQGYDNTPIKGVSYYRLKIVLAAGLPRLGQVTRLDWRAKATVLLSPNPTSGEILLQWDKTPTAVAILDMSGRIVLQFSHAPDNRYSLSGLKAGTYMVRVVSGEEVETVKLLVQ